jgi:hypothetical protein
MVIDGSHLICNIHLIETYYSFVLKEWRCIKCELEDK